VRWFLDRGLNPDVAPYFGRTGLLWAVMTQQVEVVRLLLERGADPARREEHIPVGAEGLVAVLFATDRDDPVIRQLHELLKPRSAELPPQVVVRVSRCWCVIVLQSRADLNLHGSDLRTGHTRHCKILDQ
jgi:hypothetical protein